MKQQHFYQLLCFFISSSFCQALSGQEIKNYPASNYPDRIILGYKGDPAHSQAVNWRTDSSTVKGVAAIYEAVPSPDLPDKATMVHAASLPVTLDGKQVVFHEVNFTNLKPSTAYAYRVGDGTSWSEWFHFTTASDKNDPVRILYFGDAQRDIRSLWSRAIRGGYAKMPNANLMIHAGDLVNHSYTDSEWGEWFEASGWINGMVPQLPVPGNHEYVSDRPRKRKLTAHWRPQFSLPENGPDELSETAYFIDYQNVRIISFDSEAGMQDSSVMQAQVLWLENALKNNPCRWTIVALHHPVLSSYAAKTGKNENSPIERWRTNLQAIFKKYQVDLVLQGHEHTYARGMNMPAGPSRKHPDGPVYVISVGGPKMGHLSRQSWMDRAAEDTQFYQTITIADGKLSYKAYTVRGDLYDAFELNKDEKGTKQFTEGSQESNRQELLP